MNIVALKLVTGEEILGESIINGGHVWTLKNPVGIAIVAGPDGRPNVGFSPFPLHAEQKSGTTIDIDHQHVVYYYTPAEDFKSNYEQIFGAGIILPNKQLITG